MDRNPHTVDVPMVVLLCSLERNRELAWWWYSWKKEYTSRFSLNVKKGELMSDSNLSLELELTSVVQEVKTVLTTARQNVATQVNSELLNTYWNIGRIICEHEQSDPERADYGKQTIKELSKALTKEFGKGFSRSNLQNMR